MYRLSEQDNGLYFYRARPTALRCATCGQLLDKFAQDLSSIRITRVPRLDISSSGDGVVVVSAKFRAAVLEIGASNQFKFGQLGANLATAMPTKVVQFDSVRRKTRFEELCEACGQYRSVTGATPVHLVEPSAVGPRDVARTDLEFGSNDEKSPVILFGDDIAEPLLEMGLGGLDLFST